MYAGIWEIDLHGKNEYQARVTLDAALRRVRPSPLSRAAGGRRFVHRV